MSGVTDAIKDGLDADALMGIIGERFSVKRDELNKWGLTVITSPDDLRDLIAMLRDDSRLRFDCLIDITAVDYLSYPGWRDERYGLVYILKSFSFRHRITVKVMIDEYEAEIASIHDFYRNADWLERETWDQYGITFLEHPNLKRLLNHHEFIGHPLRKDYPVQKRQHLTVNDPMIDELVQRLEARGLRVIDESAPAPTGGEA